MRVTDLSCFNIHAVWRYFSLHPMTEMEKLAMQYVLNCERQEFAFKSPVEQNRLAVERTISQIECRYDLYKEQCENFERIADVKFDHDALSIAVICRDHMNRLAHSIIACDDSDKKLWMEALPKDVCERAVFMIAESESIENDDDYYHDEAIQESFFLAHIGAIEILQDLQGRLDDMTIAETRRIISANIPAIKRYMRSNTSIGSKIEDKLGPLEAITSEEMEPYLPLQPRLELVKN